MQLIESKTYLNLAKSFAGETQARTRYEFMEYGMRNEGFTAMAEILDTLAYNEFNHARMFYTYLQKASTKPIDNIDICSGYPFREKWDVLQNLELATMDENTEATKTYPEYARIAHEEGFGEIADLFTQISKVEAKHAKILKELHTQMKSGTLYKRDRPTIWCCGGCGHEQEGTQAPTKCPLCGASQDVFMLKLDALSCK